VLLCADRAEAAAAAAPPPPESPTVA